MASKIYFSDLREHEPMSRAEEGQLTARLKRRPSESDRDRLITSNLRYVVRVAMRYRDCGMPLEDLINEGNIGLIEAVARYEPERGNRFLTYATWWIRKAILDALGRQTLVRVPSHRQEQIRAAGKEAEALRGEETGEPGDLSPELQRAVEKHEALLGARPIELSLEDVWGSNEDRSVDDLMPSKNLTDPESEVILDETKDTVRSAMAHLTRIERTIICDRFGLNDQTPRTLQAIGMDLGLSRERVRQIEIQSKDKIRRAVIRRQRRGSKGPIAQRAVACDGTQAA